MKADSLEIRVADPALLPAVAALHATYYGGTPASKLAEFEARFLDAFARERSFIVVALDHDTVVGTQTYTYWPYRDDATTYHAVQSGLTLVAESHRGRGLFSRMLEAGHRVASERGIDLMMGFPLGMSYPGFMKAGWTHLGALRWRLRPIHPLRVARHRALRTTPPAFAFGDMHRADMSIVLDERFERSFAGGLLRMPPTRHAWAGRGAAWAARHQVFCDDRESTDVVIVTRVQSTHGFAELVIGDIRTRLGAADSVVGRALAALVREAKRSMVIDAVTVLASPAPGALHRAALRRLFLWIPKTVPFIVKSVHAPLGAPFLRDVRAWSLLFSDIDTW